MTKRERFMNFLENNPVDRVPVAFFHHFCPPGEWGKGTSLGTSWPGRSLTLM